MTQPTKELSKIEVENGVLQCRTHDEQMRFCEMIKSSGLAPYSLDSASKIFVAIQQGAELGLKPMASLNAIAVINGRPTVYGKAMLGIVMHSKNCAGLDERFEGTGDDLRAICTAKRKDNGVEKSVSFSVADAKTAKLWNKMNPKGGPSPWVLYPRDMLMYKARARCIGSLFSDVLCGLPMYEDYQDVPGERVLPPPVADPLLKALPSTQEIPPEDQRLRAHVEMERHEQAKRGIVAPAPTTPHGAEAVTGVGLGDSPEQDDLDFPEDLIPEDDGDKSFR